MSHNISYPRKFLGLLIPSPVRSAFWKYYINWKSAKRNRLEFTRLLAANGLPITKNDRKISALKDIHKDEIGYLIGNGPSVRIDDLELLNGKVTFCCNRFHLAYDRMVFRPKYTLAADRQMIEDFGEEIIRKSSGVNILFGTEDPKIDGEYLWIRSKLGKGFSDNIFDFVYPGGTILISAIQIGFFLGIRRFFLYGVDHDFKFEKNVDSEDIWDNAIGEGNHFIENYRSSKPWCPPQTEMIEQSFMMCDTFLRSRGGWIKNATRGGKLDILERIDFEKAINYNNKS